MELCVSKTKIYLEIEEKPIKCLLLGKIMKFSEFLYVCDAFTQKLLNQF